MNSRILLTLLLVFAGWVNFASAGSQVILLQSTTSTQNSGLYDYLLPFFEEETGYEVRVVAVGTGQAIRNAMNGDADLILVHAKEAEEAFVEAGWGVERIEVMYNDFIIVGLAADPVGLKGNSQYHQPTNLRVHSRLRHNNPRFRFRCLDRSNHNIRSHWRLRRY